MGEGSGVTGGAVVAVGGTRVSVGTLGGIALAVGGAGGEVGNAVTLHAASATVTTMPDSDKRPELMSLIVLGRFTYRCVIAHWPTCAYRTAGPTCHAGTFYVPADVTKASGL